MPDTADKLKEAKARLANLAKTMPAVMQGFGAISRQATREGSFTAAQKELMATAIAVATGCEDCILYHLDAARKHGADEAALVEALEVAVEMGGGPAIMYAAKALDHFQALN